jgi:hypothetical protein
MVGQQYLIRNADSIPMQINLVSQKAQSFSVEIGEKGGTTTRTFNTPESMVRIESPGRPWMRANLAVFAHPFFTLSGSDGTFTITGLPAGTYELEAWHEKLGTQTARVSLPEGGTASTQFTFSVTPPKS